jgi:exodeoxyribonuclease VII large subunit
MLSHVLPVSTLNDYIQQVLAADDILADLWVEGEVTSITWAKSGHAYFKLSDGDAQIDGAMWRPHVLRQMVRPRVGDSIIVHGHIDYYSKQGRLQLIADVFEHQGQGILALELERLRQKLEAEGLFDEARKRPFPRFPRRVGVVTSDSGAVWHDIQNVASRRYPLVELVLVPASVQGPRAPAEIVAAIQYLCTLENLDVMIVGRGGGSPEDLAPFNHESVARAIFASTVPVVSAVGHETDVSIADFVADMRAPTPSAAAEIILPDVIDLQVDLADSRDTIIELMEQHLAASEGALDQLQHRLGLQSPAARLHRFEEALHGLSSRLNLATRTDLQRHANRLTATGRLLDSLHPARVLARGFAVVESPATGRPIRRAADLPDGDVNVHFEDGRATGTLRPPIGASRTDERTSTPR